MFNAEYPMVRFLERNGYNVSYTTGIDADRRGAEILEHRVFLSVGHDEYWSGDQRANVEAARAAGVHLGFFSGNEVFWKTRYENGHRTLVTYKETHANAKIDPTSAWTGTWRDPRFSPPADGNRPENALTGTALHGQRRGHDGDPRARRRRQDALLAQHERGHAGRGRDGDARRQHARLRVGHRPRQRLAPRRARSGSPRPRSPTPPCWSTTARPSGRARPSTT